MNEDLEVDLTGARKDASNHEDAAFAEVVNDYEAITAEAKASNEMEIYPKEELKTKSFKYTMNIDIENINTNEKRNKV